MVRTSRAAAAQGTSAQNRLAVEVGHADRSTRRDAASSIRRYPPHATAAANSQSVSPTPHALHKEMLWRIASLETAMARLPSRPQDLDDDSPREPIEPASFSEIDRQAVANSIAVLKTQPPEPTEPPVEALEAAQILRAVGTQRWNAASSGQADTFPSAAVKSAGSPFWLADRICALADAAINWINSLKSAF